MDKEKIFHHYSQLLDEILDNSEYYKLYFQSCYTFDDDELIYDNLTLSTGISRACLIDNNYNYVVKIPLASCHDECDREIYLYGEAIDNNVEQFFARPEFLGFYTKVICAYDIKEVEEYFLWKNQEEFWNLFGEIKSTLKKQRIIIELPLYAYPRAEAYKFNHYSLCDEIKARSIQSPLKGHNLAIAASFIGEYGEEQYQKLTSFLYDYDIDDIHLGNVGSINNHICLIDYAG